MTIFPPHNNILQKSILTLMGIYLFTLHIPHVITIRETAFFLAIVLSLVSLSKEGQWQWPPLKPYLLLWVGVAAVSLFATDNLSYSVSQIKKEIIYPLLAFWLFYAMTRNRKDFTFFLYSILFSATPIVFASIYHYFVLNHRFADLLNAGKILYGNHVSISTFMLTTLVFCVITIQLREIPKVVRTYALLLAPLSVLVIYFTRHRSSYFILAMILIFFILFYTSRLLKGVTLYKKFALYGLLIAVLLVPATILTANKELNWKPRRALNIYIHNKRWIAWNTAVKKIAEAPLLGHGFGNKYFVLPGAHREPFFAHNIFLSYGIMAGIPGIIVLLLLFSRIFRLLKANLIRFRCHAVQFGTIVNIAALIILIGFILENLKEDAMTAHIGLFFWAVMGMMLGSCSALSKLTKLNTHQVKIKASIIITAWDESQNQLIKCLDGVNLSADYVYEIVVLVNNYEKDPKKTTNILKLVSTHPKITRWDSFSQNIGIARARNIGVNMCEGEVYIILNGKCILGEGAIENLLEPFSNQFIGIVGLQGFRDGNNVKTKGLCENIHGFCMAIRKEAYQEVGGFDNEFSPLADEVEYCTRAWEKGWGIYIAEGVNFNHNYTISEKRDKDIIYGS